MTEGNDITATTLSTVGQTGDGSAAERGAYVFSAHTSRELIG